MGQSFEVLAAREVIPYDLADDMSRSVGFRNIVVHNYDVVNWQIAFAICYRHLDQFQRFAAVFMDVE